MKKTLFKLTVLCLLWFAFPCPVFSDNLQAVPWNNLPDHIKSMDITTDPQVVDCPEDLTDTPFEIVIQWIENTFYKWKEYNLPGGDICIVMVEPHSYPLKQEEARVLLKASSLWQTPQNYHVGNVELVDGSDPSLQAESMPLIELPPWKSGVKRPDGNRVEAVASPVNPDLKSGNTRTPQTIIAIDDRIEVGDTKKYPYNTICYLSFLSNGIAYRGTGFLVSPYAVLTNSHNVYDYGTSSWSTNMKVVPGQYEYAYSTVKPYGEKDYYQLVSNTSYIDYGEFADDYAVVKISTPFSGLSTYMPLKFGFNMDNSYTKLNLSGYHGTVHGITQHGQWYAEGYSSSQTNSKVAYYTVDSSAGSSGSPVWVLYPDTDSRYVVAIHAFECTNLAFNGGPRLTSSNQTLIEEWASWTPQNSNTGPHTYCIPVFKPQPAHWSGLAMTNLSNSDHAKISVMVYDKNGALLSTENRLIPVSGQISFLAGTSLTSDGWIKISSDQPLAGLNWLVKDEKAAGSYMASVPFSSSLSTSLLIPHVDHGANWDETIFLSNPNTSSASVILIYTDKNGRASTQYMISIPANGSRNIGLELITKKETASGGSVSISSSQGLAGFALFDNLKTGNHSYAGINAVDISGLD